MLFLQRTDSVTRRFGLYVCTRMTQELFQKPLAKGAESVGQEGAELRGFVCSSCIVAQHLRPQSLSPALRAL